jgi:integrase
MEVLKNRGKLSSQSRSTRAMNSKPFNVIRNRCLIETTAEHFLEVIEAGGNSTNHYLRRLHNLAHGFDWMPWNVIAPAQWPRPKRKKRRAITHEEYKQILIRETNGERRDYYELLWETGASQSDAASLTSSNRLLKNAHLVVPVGWVERLP